MIEVMNLEIEAFDSEIQVTLNHSTMGNNSTFNLVDSNVHNSIEIDGSLSRNDLYFGETIYFNETIWNQTASKFYGDIITIPIAAESHAYRVAKDAATVSGPPSDTCPFFFTHIVMKRLRYTCKDSLGHV